MTPGERSGEGGDAPAGSGGGAPQREGQDADEALQDSDPRDQQVSDQQREEQPADGGGDD